MLVKDRDQRLQSLSDAVTVLNGGALPAVPLHTPPPQLNTPPPQLNAPPPTAALVRPADRSWIWALVAILLVGVGVALTIALT